jgi:MraZ protein
VVAFYGRYTVLMDEKGRISLPAKLRPLLQQPKESSDGFMLTKGLDGCLALYPQEQWGRIQERLNTLDFTRKDFRYFSRQLYSGAVPISLDRQGRMPIPSDLQKEAGLKREVLVMGINGWIELWNPEKYEQYLTQYGQSYEEVAEQLFDVSRQQKE